jgi:hypothetical protein
MSSLINNQPYEVDEKLREYTFPGGDMIRIENICELNVSSSGTHRLKTSDNDLHIIPVGWIHVRIVSESGEWAI